MGMNAIAILHVPPSVALSALPPAAEGTSPGQGEDGQGEQSAAARSAATRSAATRSAATRSAATQSAATRSEPRDALRVGANGEPVRLTALKDAVLVPLGVSLASEPEELAERLRALVGELAEVHDEPRGVPIYPDRHELQAESWAAAVEELGEAADWIQVAEEPEDPMAAMLGGLPGAAGMPDMAAMMEQLQGADPAELMQSAMEMARQMADSGALADMARAMGAAQPPAAPAPAADPASEADAADADRPSGGDPSGGDEAREAGEGNASAQEEALRQLGVSREQLEGQLGAMGFDLGALAQQAQQMLAQDPDLERRLRESFGVGDEEGSAAGAGEDDPHSGSSGAREEGSDPDPSPEG